MFIVTEYAALKRIVLCKITDILHSITKYSFLGNPPPPKKKKILITTLRERNQYEILAICIVWKEIFLDYYTYPCNAQFLLCNLLTA